MDPALLREIQRHGWLIESVGETDCVVKCPVEGCGMRTRLKKGRKVPPRLNPAVHLSEVAESFDGIRAALRARRQELCLSITEVEEAAGMTEAHLAKFERPGVFQDPEPRDPDYLGRRAGLRADLARGRPAAEDAAHDQRDAGSCAGSEAPAGDRPAARARWSEA
jgi:hypothetical protein